MGEIMRREMFSILAFGATVAVALSGCEPQTFSKDTASVAADDTGEPTGDEPADVDDPSDADDTGSPPPSAPWTVADIQTHVVETGQTVTLEGVVITSPISARNFGFFISDKEGGPNSGIWVYAPFVEGLEVVEGQEISITGVVGEYAPGGEESGDTGEGDTSPLDDTETQTQLQITSAEQVVVTGTADIPAPTTIDSAVLLDAEAAEAYEGVFVNIEAASVTTPFGRGVFKVDDGVTIDSLFVKVDFVRLGDSFESIQGLVYFQDDTFKLEPRTETDLIGRTDSCGTCTADACIGDLSAGDLVISELMLDPESCSDFDGEYVEVYNNTAGSVDLNCLELVDGGDHLGFVETPTVVASGGYAYLERRSEDSCFLDYVAELGAPTAVYRKSVSLNNDTDTLTLSYDGTPLDSVTYDTSAAGGWPDGTGVSMVLNGDAVTGGDGAASNDSSENWCLATTTIGTTTDLGSPGAANATCP
jgi:hypothetical protein